MSKINLQRGKLTVENRKSREKKRICSEVSVNSPGNPWSQSVLFIWNIQLEGASLGIRYYLIPDWDKLGEAKVSEELCLN